MPRPKSDLVTHHINLHRGDLDELRELFPGVEPSKVVRALVRDCINKLKSNDPSVGELKVQVLL